jgi:uncharacterized protein (DUF1015 family)
MAMGHQSIEKRRAREDAYRAMETRMAADRRAHQIAVFETSSSARIEVKQRQDRFKEMMTEREKAIISKREQLAELYNNEMDAWRNEVMSKVETIEERKARCAISSCR